jgi:hypothetical protein
MDGMAILGIVLILYAAVVVWITVAKPKAIWEMAKIKMFIKWFGEKGTVIFFYVWGALALVIGVWLLMK